MRISRALNRKSWIKRDTDRVCTNSILDPLFTQDPYTPCTMFTFQNFYFYDVDICLIYYYPLYLLLLSVSSTLLLFSFFISYSDPFIYITFFTSRCPRTPSLGDITGLFVPVLSLCIGITVVCNPV